MLAHLVSMVCFSFFFPLANNDYPTKVSRPLFIEEHGLRIFLERDGVGIELSRQSYEAGEWAEAVYEAYLKGKSMKEAKKTAMVSGIGSKTREAELTRLTSEVLGWVRDWWGQ